MNVRVKPPAVEYVGGEASARYLELLTGSTETAVCFRTFDDFKERDDRDLAGNVNGSLSRISQVLAARNLAGAGIFVVVNEGGHKAAEIKCIRAVFIDGDGIPFPTKWHVPPHFITVRDESHWHAYWLVTDFPVDRFTETQQRLAAHYGSDPAVADLSRVLRVPGFQHMKNPCEPVEVTLFDFTDKSPPGKYTLKSVACGLPELPNDLDDHPEHEPGDGAPVTAAMIEEMLAHISPDLKRKEWGTVAAGIRDANVVTPDTKETDETFDGREVFCEWSRAADNFKSDDDTYRMFDDMKRKPGGASFGSLVKLARDGGYVGPVSVSRQPAPPPDSESLMARFEGLMSRFEGTFSVAVDEGAKYLRSYRVSRLDDLPDPEWLVHRIIPRNAVGYFYGGSGSMKSFTIQDLMMTAALPLDAGDGNFWMSNDSHEGFEIMGRLRSAFVILEGERGLKKRVRGWTKYRCVDAEDLDGYFTLIPDPPDISTPNGRQMLARTIRRDLDGNDADIIALDTAMVLAAANKLSLMKVDEAQVFAGLVRDLKSMFPGSAVVLVHHTGKEAEKGIIGGSNQYAGADFVFEFVRPNRKQKPPMVEVHNRKDRDEEDETHFNIQGQVIDLGHDGKGKPLSTLAVVRVADVDSGVVNGPGLTTTDAAIQVIEDAHLRDERVHGPKALADAVVSLLSPGLVCGSEAHSKAVKNAQTNITAASREWVGRGQKKTPGKLYAYKAGDTYQVPTRLRAQAEERARGRAEERARRAAMDQVPIEEVL